MFPIDERGFAPTLASRAQGLLLALAFGANGCSIVVGWDDLTGGCRGACADAGNADGGAMDDASSGSVPEAAPDASGSGGGLCAAPHAVCDDFEGPTFPDLKRWSTLDVSGDASADRVSDDRGSPGSTYRAISGGGRAQLLKSVSGKLSRVVCEFDVKPEPASPPSEFWNFAFELTPTATAAVESYLLTWGPSPAVVAESYTPRGGRFTNSPSEPPGPVPGVWQHVRLDISIGTESTIALWYGGGLIATVQLPHLPTDHDGALIAFGGATKGAGGRVTFDDIVCDVTR